MLKVRLLILNDGHELANHGMYDFPYNKHSKEQFEKDLIDQVKSIFLNIAINLNYGM